MMYCVKCVAALTWKASTFPSLYCTWLSTTSLLRRNTSLHRWKALPNLDFFRSWKKEEQKNLATTVKM